MADDTPAAAPSTIDALEERLRQVEAELTATRWELARRDREERGERGERRRGRRSERRDLSDSTRETADRTVDEVSRLFRGMTLAYAEGLRSAADAVGTFSEELNRRNEVDSDRERNLDRLVDLPADIYASYLRAFNQALRIPERAVDRFQDTYRREERRDERQDRREERARDDEPDTPR